MVAQACAVAGDFAASSAASRAILLRALAQALQDARETLAPLADRETALGLPRLQGEIDRTAFQLRGFAQILEQGEVHQHLDDAAVAGPPPAGRPQLRRVQLPLGPVAVFAASNFPFAFSVLGGDSASALAAGCPVLLKGHPGHPALTRQVVQLAQGVLAAQGLPAALFQLVEGSSSATGVALIQAPGVAAAAFTGSCRGGMALAKLASERARPIPFFGELGSVNPVLVLPTALDQQSAALAQQLAQSICQGSGQFCTSPGLVLVRRGSLGDTFIAELVAALQGQAPHAMLTASMRSNFDAGVARWRANPLVKPLLDMPAANGDQAPRPFLGEVQAGDFIAQPQLHDEVFGAAALVVRVDGVEDSLALLAAIGGSLTVTLWGAEADTPDNRRLVRAASQIAGRVLFAGVPTGVAVTAAQQHGGPFPASTAPATTSVGYEAVTRFLRPVALQDAPAWIHARAGVPV